jgi:hypothetical protein
MSRRNLARRHHANQARINQRRLHFGPRLGCKLHHIKLLIIMMKKLSWRGFICGAQEIA